MTEQVAIKRLQDHFEVHDDGRPTPFLDEAVSMAIKALEKQIAKKPFVDTGNFLKCSYCHSVIRNTDKYCHECGQKLDSEV